MSSKTTLRWGMCGLGRITSDFCSAMKTLPEGEHEITAVASRSDERAKKFAEKFGVKTWYGTYRALSKDKNVDIVYIGTNHPSHHRLCIMMLNADKHVLCEKPMTLSLKHTKEILELAKKRKLFMMEGFWTLTFPIYKQIREELSSGMLGNIHLVSTVNGVPTAAYEDWFKKETGGGMFLATGVYNTMFACMVFDELPEKILAEAYVNEKGVDEHGGVILKYKGGRMATMTYNGRSCAVTSYACIYGDKGTIEIPRMFFCPSEATMPSGKITNDKPQGPVEYFYENSGGLSYEADIVRQCILEGKTECPLVSHRLSEMVMTIVDEVLKIIGVTYDV